MNELAWVALYAGLAGLIFGTLFGYWLGVRDMEADEKDEHEEGW